MPERDTVHLATAGTCCAGFRAARLQRGAAALRASGPPPGLVQAAVVLACAKPAARRIRRWTAARLDPGCARRCRGRRTGRRNAVRPHGEPTRRTAWRQLQTPFLTGGRSGSAQSLAAGQRRGLQVGGPRPEPRRWDAVPRQDVADSGMSLLGCEPARMGPGRADSLSPKHCNWTASPHLQEAIEPMGGEPSSHTEKIITCDIQPQRSPPCWARRAGRLPSPSSAFRNLAGKPPMVPLSWPRSRLMPPR